MDLSACSCELEECKGQCECNCEPCQAAYEAAWMVQVTEKNLCKTCGIPVEISIQTLWDTQTAHFYEPCNDCKPLVEAFFLKVGLCFHCKTSTTQASPHCPMKHTA